MQEGRTFFSIMVSLEYGHDMWCVIQLFRIVILTPYLGPLLQNTSWFTHDAPGSFHHPVHSVPSWALWEISPSSLLSASGRNSVFAATCSSWTLPWQTSLSQDTSCQWVWYHLNMKKTAWAKHFVSSMRSWSWRLSVCQLQSLMMIAVERYVHICWIHHYNKILRPGVCVALIIICWLYTIIWTCQGFTGFTGWTTFKYQAVMYVCIFTSGANFSYNICLAVFGIVIPIIVLSFCYYKNLQNCEKQSKKAILRADRCYGFCIKSSKQEEKEKDPNRNID